MKITVILIGASIVIYLIKILHDELTKFIKKWKD